MGKPTANLPPISLEELAQCLTPFYLLTSSAEKANCYQFYLTKLKSKSTPTFIESPGVLSLSNWCLQSYKQRSDRMTVLSPDQRLNRLIQVIRETSTISSLFDCIQVADTLSKLLHKIHMEDHSRDTLQQCWVEPKLSYHTIYRAYLATLSTNREIDTLHIIRTMTDIWMQDPPTGATHWVFEYPDQLPMRYQRLYNHLHKKGLAYALASPSNKAPDYHRMESHDPQLGYHDFIHWYKQHPEPGATALVIPNLSSHLAEIDRIIGHWQCHYHIPRTDIAIMVKRPLASLRIAQAVLLLMELYHDVITINTLVDFVSSPYILSANRLDKVQLLQALEKLAGINDRLLSPQSLRQQLSTLTNDTDCPITTRLIHLLQHVQSPSHLPFFQHILSALTITTFPVAIDQEEKKALRLLNQLLLSLAHTHTSYTPEEGLVLFRALCQQSLVSESHPNRPIHIIDLSQAPSGIYPYTWYANLDEEQLQANNPERIDYLMQASPHIVLQFARYANGCEQNIAPSILSYWKAATPIQQIASCNLHPLEPVEHELYRQPTYLPLNAQEKQIGTYHLKTFQQCPFKSFSRYRLHCPIPEPTQFGFSAKDRGIILHDLLQNLFQAYPDSSDLVSLRKNPTPINKLIAKQLNKAVGVRKHSLNPSYLRAEEQRLRQLIDHYIDIELERPPFVVRFIEKRLQIQICNLTINGIIDRVDESNSQYILIDYKTGQASHHEWFGEFLDPQLPCYAQHFRHQAVTVSLALFTHSTFRYAGITHEDHPFFNLASRYPNAGNSWSDIQIYWQDTLHQVAEQYQQGLLTLTPHKNKFCNQCHYQRLCRVWDKQGGTACSAP